MTTMAATDAQIIVAAARWTNETQYLRDFITKNRTPCIVKVVKGQYGTIGVPSLSNPGLQSIVLLLSTGKRRKVIAQAVKFKENRVVPVGSRISIPVSYNGWFELLSEEGRSIKCVESVADLSKMKFDDKYLIRDTIKCLVGKGVNSLFVKIANVKLIFCSENYRCGHHKWISTRRRIENDKRGRNNNVVWRGTSTIIEKSPFKMSRLQRQYFTVKFRSERPIFTDRNR